MISLGAVKQSRSIQIAAACGNSPEFVSLVNDACRRLLRRGDWFNTFVPMFVCVFQGCLVWPRYVAQVRKVNVCNVALPVHNAWYEFLPSNQRQCGGGWGMWGGFRGPECGVFQQGTSPVLQDVMGDGRLIRAYARCQPDLGKTIKIFGTDNNGQPLMTRDNNGDWTPGITLVLAAPFASTSTYVRHIDYVIKDQTQCIVDVYGYNAATNLLEDIAHYEGNETEPSYVRQKLNVAWPTFGTGSIQPNCCGTKRGVLAMVKLRHVDAQVDSDLLVMDNIDAIKLEIMSIKAEEASNFKEKQQWEASAVEVLNRDLEINSPDEEFSAAPNVLGPRVWSNQCR